MNGFDWLHLTVLVTLVALQQRAGPDGVEIDQIPLESLSCDSCSALQGGEDSTLSLRDPKLYGFERIGRQCFVNRVQQIVQTGARES